MATCNVVIDLSHNNANIDLARAKADGVQGLIHKANGGPCSRMRNSERVTITDVTVEVRKQTVRTTR